MQSPPVDVAELVAVHQAGVWRYLRFLGCSAAEAEDLAQETFLAVLRRPFEDQGRAAAAGYLRTVARNLFLKHRASVGRAPAAVDLDRADVTWRDLAEEDGGDAYLDALRACLGRLEPRPRRALELQYASGRSRAEIAADLGLGEEGIKTLLRRARALLRACIETRLRAPHEGATEPRGFRR